MHQLKKIAIALVCASTITSCSTFKHSYRVSDAPTKKIGVTQTVVDVVTDFDRKVKGSSDRLTSSVQDAKANAYFNAIQENDIDVLVDPIYSIRVRRGLFKSSAKASVSGFAGEFTNPRSLAENQQETYDAKIIVNEDKKTTIIGFGDNGKSSSQTINSAPSLMDQFNSLYDGSTAPDSEETSGGGPPSDNASAGFIGKLLKK